MELLHVSPFLDDLSAGLPRRRTNRGAGPANLQAGRRRPNG